MVHTGKREPEFYGTATAQARESGEIEVCLSLVPAGTPAVGYHACAILLR